MNRHTPRTKRAGQVVVLFPVALIMLVAMASLSVDVGRIMRMGARLQNAADASSLAAAQVLMRERLYGTAEQHARELALAEAVAIHQANAPESQLVLQFGYLDGDGEFVRLSGNDGETESDDFTTPATAVRTRVFRQDGSPGGPLSLFFAPMLGVPEANVGAAAVSEIQTNIIGFRSGLTPIAVNENLLVDPGGLMVIYPPDDPTAPGNFGLLNFDGGSCGTPELRDWILNGYSGEFQLDEGGSLWINGTTGFRADLESSFEQRIGDVLTVVLFDAVTGEGSNAMYHCIGFAGVSIQDCHLTGHHPYILVRVEGFRPVHDAITGSLGVDTLVPNLAKVCLIR